MGRGVEGVEVGLGVEMVVEGALVGSSVTGP